MRKYYRSGYHGFWSSAWLFLISLIWIPFMKQNFFFSCKTTEILTVPSLDNLCACFPCVSFYLCFSFFLPFSIQGSPCMAAILLGRSLHCLFSFNIQMLNLNSCLFRHHVRMVRTGVWRHNFFSPLSTPFLWQPCRIAHCFAFLSIQVFTDSNDPDLSLTSYKQKMIAKHGTVPGEPAWKAADKQCQGMENSHRYALWKELSRQLNCHI